MDVNAVQRKGGRTIRVCICRQNPRAYHQSPGYAHVSNNYFQKSLKKPVVLRKEENTRPILPLFILRFNANDLKLSVMPPFMLGGRLPLTEIAYAAGFASAIQFLLGV